MLNPLVIGDSGLRFYAGAPLLSPMGLHWELLERDFGAVAKDDAQRRVAKVLKGQARGYDTLACLDSDSHRFAVLMPGADDAKLTAVAARLHRAVVFAT